MWKVKINYGKKIPIWRYEYWCAWFQLSGYKEVALGSYGCDGSFQLFDVETVEKIMTHELGHTIGFGGHSDNPDDMMYGTMSPGYAYCLLG